MPRIHRPLPTPWASKTNKRKVLNQWYKQLRCSPNIAQLCQPCPSARCIFLWLIIYGEKCKTKTYKNVNVNKWTGRWLSWLLDVMCRKFMHSTVIELVRFVFNAEMWSHDIVAQVSHYAHVYVVHSKAHRHRMHTESCGNKEKHNRNATIYRQRCGTNIPTTEYASNQKQKQAKTIKPKIMHLSSECAMVTVMQKYFEWSTMTMTTTTTQPWAENRSRFSGSLSSVSLCSPPLSHWIFNTMKNNVIIGSSFILFL